MTRCVLRNTLDLAWQALDNLPGTQIPSLAASPGITRVALAVQNSLEGDLRPVLFQRDRRTGGEEWAWALAWITLVISG